MSLGRSQTLCRYYLHGICRFGDLCRFSHDLSNQTIASPNPGGQNSNPGEMEDQVVASTSSFSRQRIWANAPVFVPMNSAVSGPSGYPGDICPHAGQCPLGDRCPFPVHLELCEMCLLYCLHPRDPEQRRDHNRECLEEHEQAMELSFAIARSKDKTCGICFDTVVEKEERSDRRFGILSKCNHVFCIDCIRRWRQAKQFEAKVTRACPECRVCSDFVCPSAFWVDTKEEKDKLLNSYRTALGAKDCKYFRFGQGRCPFGNKCFYKHALANGTIVDVGLPKRTPKNRNNQRNLNENRHLNDNDNDTDLMDFLDYYPWRMADRLDQHWLELFSSDLSDISEGSEDEN
ncbi:hypothetical protein KR084_004666 [Drosophila pseudotakahashii]|nr:hypothetical protein KR084_004666 [Drosophila pseudotakahashii]